MRAPAIGIASGTGGLGLGLVLWLLDRLVPEVPSWILYFVGVVAAVLLLVSAVVWIRVARDWIRAQRAAPLPAPADLLDEQIRQGRQIRDRLKRNTREPEFTLEEFQKTYNAWHFASDRIVEDHFQRYADEWREAIDTGQSLGSQATVGQYLELVELRIDALQRIRRGKSPTSDPSPEFEVMPRIDLRMRETDNGYAYDSEAVLWVRNARDSGGEGAVARGVTPEIEILHGGAAHTSNVGWETVASRDLRATRESYPVHVAFKQAGSAWPTADLRSPTETMGGPLWGPRWDVRLTLRGDNWQGPRTYDFVLHNVGGASGGLRLEEAN